MLHETFKNQVRTSQSAPVQIEGGGIGMVRCSREVLFAVCPFPPLRLFCIRDLIMNGRCRRSSDWRICASSSLRLRLG